MIFVIKLKKYMNNIYIFDIIINKLNYKKKLYLVILLKFDKSLKISFHYTILPFSLVVYL